MRNYFCGVTIRLLPDYYECLDPKRYKKNLEIANEIYDCLEAESERILLWSYKENKILREKKQE